ncbi:SIMPL domain-containing protein [Halopelagius fulvigenes]|uniref:SIMPL domain-containing protein n=1 Tax=Halopelagius fulvigenes TaxID=1198324 RepID=A0ABD5TZ78_9EURY
MRYRAYLLPTALAVLVLLSGCLAPLQTDGGSDDGAAAGPATISASGSGDVTAEADLAVISVSVTATADSANAARERVAEDADRMRQALRDAGVPDDAVETTAYRVDPQYDHSGGNPEVVGYRAVHTYSVEVEPARAGEIVDVAVGNGANEVGHVAFTLTEETRAELRQQAIERAMDAARTDAETLASASNLTLGEVRSASTDGSNSPMYYDRAAAETAAGGSTSFEPGPVTVTATVSVTYEAE